MGHARRDGRCAGAHRFQPRDGGGTQRHSRSASRRSWLDTRSRGRVERGAGSESRKLHRREKMRRHQAVRLSSLRLRSMEKLLPLIIVAVAMLGIIGIFVLAFRWAKLVETGL